MVRCRSRLESHGAGELTVLYKVQARSVVQQHIINYDVKWREHESEQSYRSDNGPQSETNTGVFDWYFLAIELLKGGSKLFAKEFCRTASL